MLYLLNYFHLPRTTVPSKYFQPIHSPIHNVTDFFDAVHILWLVIPFFNQFHILIGKSNSFHKFYQNSDMCLFGIVVPDKFLLRCRIPLVVVLSKETKHSEVLN
jgi:hypothetical protein